MFWLFRQRTSSRRGRTPAVKAPPQPEPEPKPKKTRKRKSALTKVLPVVVEETDRTVEEDNESNSG